MNKIVVEVRVPAINKVYDARIPKDIQVWEMVKMITDMISRLEPEMYSQKNQVVLCDYDTGKKIDINSLVAEAGLVNGTRLLLV